MTAVAAPVLTTGHVGLNVTDLDRSATFYRRGLGFQELGRGADGDRRWAFLGVDGVLMLTLWQQSTGEFATAAPGLHHLAFQVADVDAVRLVESVLRELDAEFFHEGVVAHGEGASSGGIFFADPDGIRLEVYAPTGAETAPAPAGNAPTCGFF
ncbi:VOC family protein [Nocardia caishijiensis]|uniref:Glyoxalase/bleomycin resistance protein/dioxygenase superfamily protein n=1 Tax=Nocardia caishijiensis TaxID=184756 RepID=A0ABQ6YQ39_9NOCA|nr:VOC family protein [Nocardia caishijiensis]KAF0847685.1 glyoxalase/bleomycin resistance protein/dioxygenase superfamily protein [Nocardia caishijiensis]